MSEILAVVGAAPLDLLEGIGPLVPPRGESIAIGVNDILCMLIDVEERDYHSMMLCCSVL